MPGANGTWWNKNVRRARRLSVPRQFRLREISIFEECNMVIGDFFRDATNFRDARRTSFARGLVKAGPAPGQDLRRRFAKNDAISAAGFGGIHHLICLTDHFLNRIGRRLKGDCTHAKSDRPVSVSHLGV